MIKNIVYVLASVLLLSSLACQDAKPEQEATISDATAELKKENVEQQTKITNKKTYLLPEWPEKAKVAKGKEYPFDEGTQDADFVKFRMKLYQAVKEKDVDFILSILADDISFDFSGGASKADFIKEWQLDVAPKESKIWKELAFCLELGGKWNTYDDTKRFVAPYVFMLESFEDAFSEGVIVGDNVRLRAGASSTSEIIGSLSWDHYTLMDQDDFTEEEIGGVSHYWMKIETLNGEKGYVYGKYTRSPIDYRVAFEKQADASWKIGYFIAGD